MTSEKFQSSLFLNGVLAAHASNRCHRFLVSVVLCAAVLIADKTCFAGGNHLEEEFRDPPMAVRPTAFWPWIGGHITKEGIRADLEAMKMSGMRGGILFDLSLYIPEGDIAYDSQEWWDLLDYAIKTGDEMGLEIGFQNCPGWATSGGPWVTPEDSMKRMVFSETIVDSSTARPIQLAMPTNIREEFYRDVTVIAIPQKVVQRVAKVELDDVDVSGLQDAERGSSVPILSGEPMVFIFDFDEPTMISTWAMDVVGNAAGSFDVVVESSMDRELFDSAEKFTAGGRLRGNTPLTHSFDPVEGRVFRVTLTAPFNRERVVKFQVASLNLLPDARLSNYSMISMGASSAARRFHPSRMPSLDEERAIDPEDILDLSDCLALDGTLSWSPPAGTWTLLRFGYTSTGAKNHPARVGGQGLEVNKMDEEAVRRFFAAAVAPVLERSKGKVSMISIDSWEAGLSNWTSRFPEEFKIRCGYEIWPFLPVLTGRIVGSPADSYAFLQDFRVTITELIAENYHRVMQDEASKFGSEVFLEPYPGWNIDEFKSSRFADLVAAEFWVHDVGDFGTTMSSVRRTSAMVETIKEDKRLSAEAFTGRPADAGWRSSPRSLKRVADSAMVNGVNDFAFHSFVHQPRDDMQPGFTHGRYGTEFGRHNIWWPMAGAFTDYLARCGLMLRQGNRVADFLFLKNEGTFMDDRFPDVPSGYEYLYIAPFTLLESKVEGGKVVTPGGGRHSVVVVPAIWVADIALLEKLLELKEAGIPVLGSKPVMPAGRNDIRQLEKWNALVDGIFPEVARLPSTERLAEVAQSLNMNADFSFDLQDAPLEYVHRRTGGLDIYFVRNAGKDPVTVDGRFRVATDRGQFWNPLDGSVRSAHVTIQGDSECVVPIELPALGSTFVVFGLGNAPAGPELPLVVSTEIILDGWEVVFQSPRGESFEREFEMLSPWNESEDNAIKYFSGAAVYSGTFQLSDIAPTDRVFLDLGAVHEMARVRINDRDAGICWTPPDSLDVTLLVQSGVNRLEIEVVNTWVNRLIGDEFLPAESEFSGISGNAGTTAGVLKKFPDWYQNPDLGATRQRTTFAAWRHYDRNSPLTPSGLLGPVVVRVMKIVE
ncbi:glycosyl hydrolase [Coraliomargarita sp. W4R72]